MVTYIKSVMFFLYIFFIYSLSYVFNNCLQKLRKEAMENKAEELKEVNEVLESYGY